MMMIAVIALASTAQAADNDAVALLSRVLLHYRNTVSAKGTVKETVSDGKGSKDIVTEFAYVKPSLLWVTQTQTGVNGWTYAAKCDGRLLVYDPPFVDNGIFRRPQKLPVLETVKLNNGYMRTVPDLYGGFRPLLPTADNPPLDIVMSRKEHLEYLREQWGTITSLGKGTYNGTEVTWIGGDYKPTGTFVSGAWKMGVNASDDIVRYELTERFSVNPGDDQSAVKVYYSFDVSVKLNDKIDEGAFTINKEVVKKIVADMAANGQDVRRFIGG